MKATPFLWFVIIVGGYLFGSVLFSYLIPVWVLRKDIREEHADHNPGAANVFSSCGVLMGLFCLFLDLSKGLLPVALAVRALNVQSFWFVLVMSAPVIGHAWPLFRHFQGGKCIATSFGVLLGLVPFYPVYVCILALLYIIFSTILLIRPNSRRSIMTFQLFSVLSLIYSVCIGAYSVGIGCSCISAIVIIKHLMAQSKPAEDTGENTEGEKAHS